MRSKLIGRPGRRRLTLTAAAALMLGALPVAAQDVAIPYTTFTLPNGLRVIVNEDRSVPIVAVNIWYHVGSAREAPGRTGFAHLFEHIMFEGSANVPEGEFDNLLEAAGALNNGSTSPDRTNYYITLPSNALELALWLEADRMGGLLETLTQEKLDIQRDVVRNERRQGVENRPYGTFWEVAYEALYPAGHPYSWSTIGSMEDLSAATLDDVVSFFQRYYVPNNAVLVISGDVEASAVRPLVARYFGWIPAGETVDRPERPVPAIPATRHIVVEDRVTLPQVSLIWRTAPAYAEPEAALTALAQLLTAGKNSRLFRRLVYEEQTAQNVSAFNYSQLVSGDFFISVTGTPDMSLGRLESAVLEEVRRIAETPPTQEEMARVINGVEMASVTALETIESKADQLNSYHYYTGDPNYAAEELARYRALTPADLQRAARTYLHGKNRIVVSYVPQGRTDLAAQATEVQP